MNIDEILQQQPTKTAKKRGNKIYLTLDFEENGILCITYDQTTKQYTGSYSRKYNATTPNLTNEKNWQTYQAKQQHRRQQLDYQRQNHPEYQII